MTDYHRMEWQVRANKIATFTMVFCVFLSADEVIWAFRYHFPWWDDFLAIFTFIVMNAARFIQRHTDMYRFDR